MAWNKTCNHFTGFKRDTLHKTVTYPKINLIPTNQKKNKNKNKKNDTKKQQTKTKTNYFVTKQNKNFKKNKRIL